MFSMAIARPAARGTPMMKIGSSCAIKNRLTIPQLATSTSRTNGCESSSSSSSFSRFSLLAQQHQAPPTGCRSFSYKADDPTHQKIKEIIDGNDVTLFMKGNPIFPQCGFSRTVCEVLKREGLEGKFHSVNILEDQAIREGVKEFSDWPTIPQLYVKGEFIGGCDIVLNMHRDGELKNELKSVVEKATK